MRRLVSWLRALRRDARGGALTEFGLLIVPLCVVLLGLFDMGYDSYAKSVMSGTLYRAARRATTGNYTTSQIDTWVTSQLTNFNRRATVSITKRSYYDFTGVQKPEKIVGDTVPLGVYNVGDCFEDDNGNNQYDDGTTAGNSGLGGSDDIVYYSVTMTFPRMFPLYRFLRWSSTMSVTGTTVLRNQPYASQATPRNIKLDASGNVSAC
ncbi:MAG: pilus assembly protein [Sphingomonadaceae bacterium]|nr:pilus assembly protein [Sphingomonadaceae bacterium]